MSPRLGRPQRADTWGHEDGLADSALALAFFFTFEGLAPVDPPLHVVHRGHVHSATCTKLLQVVPDSCRRSRRRPGRAER